GGFLVGSQLGSLVIGHGPPSHPASSATVLIASRVTTPKPTLSEKRCIQTPSRFGGDEGASSTPRATPKLGFCARRCAGGATRLRMKRNAIAHGPQRRLTRGADRRLLRALQAATGAGARRGACVAPAATTRGRRRRRRTAAREACPSTCAAAALPSGVSAG